MAFTKEKLWLSDPKVAIFYCRCFVRFSVVAATAVVVTAAAALPNTTIDHREVFRTFLISILFNDKFAIQRESILLIVLFTPL